MRPRWACLVLGVALVLLLPACDWPSPGFDAANSGFNPGESVIGVSNLSKVKRRWVRQTGAPVVGTVEAAGVVFVVNRDGLETFDAETGARGWTEPGAASAIVGRGKVFVTTSGGLLRALDAATGATRWTSAEPASNARLSGETVYATGPRQTVRAYDADDGVLSWALEPSADTETMLNPLGVADGLVYVSTFPLTSPVLVPSIVRAYDATDGALRWETPTNSAAVGAPTVAGGRVFIPMFGGVATFDAATGAPGWSAGTGLNDLGFGTDVAVAYGTVFATTPGSGIFTFDAATGTPGWTDPGPVLSSPSVAKGVVYVIAAIAVLPSGGTGGLVAHDVGTGAQLLTAIGPGSGDDDERPIVANGRVYVGGADGRIYAYAVRGT